MCTLLWLMNLHGSSRSVVGRCVARNKTRGHSIPCESGFFTGNAPRPLGRPSCPILFTLGHLHILAACNPRGGRGAKPATANFVTRSQ